MSIRRIALVILASLLGAAAAAGAGEVWPAARMVTITGVPVCYNYSHALGLWSVVPRKERPALLMVRDGDILAVFSVKEDGKDRDDPVFVPYLEADGTTLALRYEGKAMSLGGRTVALRLDDDSAAWEWVKTATAEQLKALRCLTLHKKLDPARLELLKKIAAANPAIDLAIDDEESVTQVLPLFRPRRLLLPGPKLGDAEQKLLVANPNLETLWIDGGETDSLALAEHLPALRRLLVSSVPAAKAGLFPWGARRLRSLSLTDAKFKDLSPIEHLTDLRALRLGGAKELADLRAIARLTLLESVAITGDHAIEDFSPLGSLPKLKQLSITVDFKKGGLEALVEGVPQIETLDLIGGSDGGEDEKPARLQPLTRLTKLRNLFLLGLKADLAPLREMKQLRVIVLETEVFEKAPDQVAALQKALPDAKLAEGHVCLGSGWLLLLLPALLLGWVLSRRRRATGARHA